MAIHAPFGRMITAMVTPFNKDKKIDFFVNRIECFNPLTSENLIKMSSTVTEISKDILPESVAKRTRKTDPSINFYYENVILRRR